MLFYISSIIEARKKVKRVVFILGLSIVSILISTGSAKAQIPGGFGNPNSSDPFSNGPSIDTPNSSPAQIINPNPEGGQFPNLSIPPTQENPWTFNQATQAFTTNTSFGGFSTNSSGVINSGGSSFGNQNDCGGLSGYAEIIGGKNTTNSSTPNEIDLNNRGVTARAGIKFGPRNCPTPTQIESIKEMEIDAQLKNTCAIGMTALQMNGKAIPIELQKLCGVSN